MTPVEKRRMSFRRALASLRKVNARKTVSERARQRAIERLDHAARRLSLNIR